MHSVQRHKIKTTESDSTFRTGYSFSHRVIPASSKHYESQQIPESQMPPKKTDILHIASPLGHRKLSTIRKICNFFCNNNFSPNFPTNFKLNTTTIYNLQDYRITPFPSNGCSYVHNFIIIPSY